MPACIRAIVALGLICLAPPGRAQSAIFPPRPTNAPTGSEFVRSIEALEFDAREEAIFEQINSGNVPDFLRTFCTVSVTNIVSNRTNIGMLHGAPDYLAVGTDADYFLTPMSPFTAQRLAGRLRCQLPTRKIVDAIWQAAAVKLAPAPLTPGADMVTVRQFAKHNSIIHTQRRAQAAFPLGKLVAGHKKDVVITPRLGTTTNRVAIYGWHKADGKPIQPLYLGHTAAWVDYSHGIRLVHEDATVNGQERRLADVLGDPVVADLFSDEGPLGPARYGPEPSSNQSDLRKDAKQAGKLPSLGDFKPVGPRGECAVTFNFDPEVRVLINAPALGELATGKPVRLILYALPNGNTIEQTIGKKIGPGDDWHYNIQHIGAQTRWLRQRLTNEVLLVAYLEAAMKSWPAWRQKHGDQRIPKLVDAVRGMFQTNQVEIVLTGHSGGGSLTFGYINAVERIPDEIGRIAFLDSNYAYRTTNHFQKLLNWLKADNAHYLCVLAYQDYLGLLEGKSFVSEQGGTWGRSQEMLRDFGSQFRFEEKGIGAGLRSLTALQDRVAFLLKENPERKILHTVQVERNGFIHSQLTGTGLAGIEYEYLGDRVYDQFVE